MTEELKPLLETAKLHGVNPAAYLHAAVLAADRKVALRRIVAGAQTGSLLIVEQGLQPGEEVVVSGHQNARPGATVAPQSAEAASAGPVRPQSTK